MQIPEFLGLGLAGHPVHGIRFPDNMDKFNVMDIQRRIQGVQHIDNGRGRGQQAAFVGRAGRVCPFREIQGNAKPVKLVFAVYRNCPGLLVIVAAVNGKLEASLVAAAAFGYPDYKLRSRQNALACFGHFNQRALAVAGSFHRPDRQAG